MGERYTVVRAAAGCGKTTDLARRYLSFIRDGIPVDRAIAITFTRRAAAELQERVSLALRAASTGPGAEHARRRLGSAWQLYASVAPEDPDVVTEALERLPDAPIGTTDAFVQRLLTEFALDAGLPVPGGEPVPLDVPITPGRGVARALDRAARRVLDPPDGGIDPEVAPLLRHLTLDELRTALVRRSPEDALPPARATEVLALLARDLARVTARHDLALAYDVGDASDAPSWRQAMASKTNVAGKWAVSAVADWLATGASESQAPYELAGWLTGLNVRSKARRALHEDLQRTDSDYGMGRLSLWDVVTALEYPYDQAGHVEEADTLRAAIHRLRQRVVTQGLRAAALAGDLGYDELLEAAIALCDHPPARLQNRFRALLVDEVQDANPAQLRLYRAIARLPAEEPVESYFVGDARQSIYLFRHAEPQGLVDLERDSIDQGREPIELRTNHRSAPRLVAAQRALFAALDGPMRAHRLNPLASLDALAWRDDNERLALAPDRHHPDAPVWLVTAPDIDPREADRRALHAFAGRTGIAWREPGHEQDTAVVLTPTWRAARQACQQLRRWAGRDDIAWVDGSTGWASGRVGTDVALHLRALADPADEIAWMGVLKHPGFGLSDAALARIHHGKGLWNDGPDGPDAPVPAPDRARHLGFVVDVDHLGEPHDPSDRRAFARSAAPIRHARSQLGRRGTAEVLDELITALNWRAVLKAGPGGDDDVAQLEVLLDWVRTLDDDGMAPDGVVSLLADSRTEAPHIHLVRPGQHIVCTTVYQAKGLAWDHVCVLSIGRVPGGGDDDAPGWMDVGGSRVRLEGVRFDPYGGITPFSDPIGRLARRLHRHRRAEESARLAYVAVTRARRSVTVGLPGPGRERDQDISMLLRDAWLSDALEDPDIARIDAAAVTAPDRPPVGWAAPSPSATRMPPTPQVPAPMGERAPSSMGAHLDGEARAQLAEGVMARVRLANGLFLGGEGVAPPGTDPVTGLAVRGHRFSHVRPTDWGDIAHGWLAHWGFGDDVPDEAVDEWLRDTWGAPDGEVRDWLIAMCAGLKRHGGPLWDQVTAPDRKLHFELPFVGLGTQERRGVLLSGRIDLVVEQPGGRLWVIDFKAGAHAPTGWHDVVEGASLKTYAPQLDAYAQALRGMGRTVDVVALWFVRTGTSVSWTP